MLDVLDFDGPMPLLRTNFTDDAAWRRVVTAVTAEVHGPDFGGTYTPNIQPIENQAFEGATGESLAAQANDKTYGYVILADARSMRESAGGELTVRLVDLSVAPEDAEEFGWLLGREFRSVVTEVASIEANLSIANMDFDEFADAVEEDGVFRGF